MHKTLLTLVLGCFCTFYANAQLGVMKLVGSDSENFNLGYGAFIKTGIPVKEGSSVTVELGLNYFPYKDGEGQGTIMCPLKLGYKYILNKTSEGFYLEPQLGYNVYGISSVPDEDGYNVDFKYHGVVLAAGGGYAFLAGNVPIDVNLRYETVIANGGSNNFISLGITKSFSFGKKN
ncbi:MAG: hypothetical protein EOO06_19010 [Chitinophagaceae bacterium]|nr:MAG: hypothetical protein EOO06_19010 [Chitinophagaceae bacterium]